MKHRTYKKNNVKKIGTYFNIVKPEQLFAHKQ